MILTNEVIYNHAVKLNEAFQDNEQKLPIKINFYLQKNKNLLIEMGAEIEKAKINIAKEYGTLNPEKESYIIPPEKVDFVLNELNDLYKLKQEVPIYKIKLSDFGDNLSLTTMQMESIMFMIDEN